MSRTPSPALTTTALVNPAREGDEHCEASFANRDSSALVKGGLPCEVALVDSGGRVVGRPMQAGSERAEAIEGSAHHRHGIIPLDEALGDPTKYESEIKYHVMTSQKALPDDVLARVAGHTNVMRCLLDLVPSPFTSDAVVEALGQCSRLGDCQCCGGLMEALGEPRNLLSALTQAVINRKHRVAMRLLGKCDPTEELLREAFNSGDSRMFGLLINLSSSVDLGIEKLFDGSATGRAQRRLLEAVVCSGLVADRLTERNIAAVLDSLPLRAKLDVLRLRARSARFHIPDLLADSCANCGVDGFLVGPPIGLLANLPIVGSRASSRSACNCAACGSAICGKCRRTCRDAGKASLCRECFRMAMGKWNLDSASTTTAGDEEAQGTGDSESHRQLDAIQRRGFDGPSLKERLLRLMASNEETLERVEQLERQFDDLCGAFEALAAVVPPQVSREIAGRFGLAWFDLGCSDALDSRGDLSRRDTSVTADGSSSSRQCCPWRAWVSECLGLPRLRVFASPALRLRVCLRNETLDTSWTSAEVDWSDQPTWEPPTGGLEFRPGDEVRLSVISPDAVVGESLLTTLRADDGGRMEVPLWRGTVGDSSLRLPSGRAVLLMAQSGPPPVTAVLRLIAIDDVDLASDPPPSAVSVTFTVKSSGEAQQLRLPHDSSMDAQPVELRLDPLVEKEHVIASLQVDGWGVVGVGEKTLNPRLASEELLIELWRTDDGPSTMSDASGGCGGGQDCVGIITVHVTYS
ncbi:hypothetical protein FOZ61_004382 [Perkinsus olseni]|uniref:Uncharacterized protein n=1 Tax=Perkinsus olseni TaxID=32597 RepID=A0A7J6MTT9_PEROL|nr:hypothetical protein FOZ61_004382 [Perkinsus olseni]KAF4674640.1 hypothetical protein FOL46_004427 [Perkinsus olseni]